MAEEPPAYTCANTNACNKESVHDTPEILNPIMSLNFVYVFKT